MKSSKLSRIGLILFSVLFTANTFAQSTATVPDAVSASLKSKYPDAVVKKWTTVDNEYTAKTRNDGKKQYISFNNGGNWVKTVTRYNWPGHLNPVVNKAFKTSQYGAWHVYGVNVVETPAGQFYQVLVDDSNHKINSNHQELFTETRLVEFKATGELIADKNINDNPTLD